MEEEPSVAQLSPPDCLWGFFLINGHWAVLPLVSGCIRKQAEQAMGSQPVSSVSHGFCFSFCSDFPSCWLSLRWINPFLIHLAFGHSVYHSSRNLKTVDKPNSSCGRKEDSWDRKVKRCLALSRAGSSYGWGQDLLSLPLNLSYFLSLCEVQPLWVGTSFYNPCPHFSWVVS